MDVLDQLGLGQDEHFGAVLEVAAVPGEPLAAEVLLGQLVGVNQSPHRPVEDHDPPIEDLVKPVVCHVRSICRHHAIPEKRHGAGAWPIAVKPSGV